MNQNIEYENYSATGKSLFINTSFAQNTVVSKTNGLLDVTIEWIFPGKISNDKGEKYKTVKYTIQRPTNIPSASSYSLDEPYELVKGKWTMNMYIENKKMYSRTFTLY